MDNGDGEAQPTGRQFAVSVGFAVLGVPVLGYGVLAPQVLGTIAGVVLIVFFGARAAGARHTGVSAGKEGLSAEANYAAPKPTRGPGLWLPRSRRPRRPPNSEDTEPAED